MKAILHGYAINTITSMAAQKTSLQDTISLTHTFILVSHRKCYHQRSLGVYSRPLPLRHHQRVSKTRKRSYHSRTIQKMQLKHQSRLMREYERTHARTGTLAYRLVCVMASYLEKNKNSIEIFRVDAHTLAHKLVRELAFYH